MDEHISIQTKVELKGHQKSIYDIIYLEDYKRIVSIDLGGAMIIWDSSSYKELHRTNVKDQGVADTIWLRGSEFVTVRYEIVLHNAMTFEQTTISVPGKSCYRLLRLSDDDILYAENGNNLCVLNITSRSVTKNIEINPSETTMDTKLCHSQKYRNCVYLNTIVRDEATIHEYFTNSVALLDYENGKIIRNITFEKEGVFSIGSFREGENEYVIVCGQSRNLRIVMFQLDKTEVIHTIQTENPLYSCLCINNSILFIGDSKGRLHTLSVFGINHTRMAKKLKTARVHAKHLNRMELCSVTHDAIEVLTCSDDYTVKIIQISNVDPKLLRDRGLLSQEREDLNERVCFLGENGYFTGDDYVVLRICCEGTQDLVVNKILL